MSDYDEDDLSLTAAQRLAIARLTVEQIKVIDAALFANVTISWRKVAMVVMLAMEQCSMGITDLYFGHRVKALAEAGLIESDGDLDYMGRSEVRLPH